MSVKIHTSSQALSMPETQPLYTASDWKVDVRKFPVLPPAPSPSMIGTNLSKLFPNEFPQEISLSSL